MKAAYSEGLYNEGVQPSDGYFKIFTCLAHELIDAKDERRLMRFQKMLSSFELLIIDELGFVPLSKTGAELLFEVFSRRCAIH